MTRPSTFALLVPCKNGARFLPRLFASAHAQTRRFDEIWLFDDGSEDDSSGVAERLGAKVIRSEKSLGPSAARNRLTAACACEWLHFHDADDTMDPRYLERVSVETGPGIDIVICDMVWIDEESGQIDNRWTYNGDELARHPSAYLLLNTVGGINGLYRRSALTAAGGFSESLRFWEDMELNLRFAQKGSRTKVVNENLVTAYRRKNSYSNSNLGEVWRVKLQIMDRLREAAHPLLLNTIAAEAETIAVRFAALNLWQDVATALAFSRLAGGDPPRTHSGIFRVVKKLLPAAWAFRAQYAWRKFRAR